MCSTESVGCMGPQAVQGSERHNIYIIQVYQKVDQVQLDNDKPLTLTLFVALT